MTNVTAQDILDLMPIIADRNWTTRSAGQIRNELGRCPLVELAEELGENCDGNRISYGHVLTDIPPVARGAIVLASDFSIHEYRAELEWALGMR